MIEEPIAKTHEPEEPSTFEANGSSPSRSVLDLLTSLNDRVATGTIEELVPMATGFTPLDKACDPAS
jgi:hypothetical protein